MAKFDCFFTFFVCAGGTGPFKDQDVGSGPFNVCVIMWNSQYGHHGNGIKTGFLTNR